MNISYCLEKFRHIFSSNCSRRKKEFVLKSEIQNKNLSFDVEKLKDKSPFFKTPPNKEPDYSSQNDLNSNKINSISFCERLFNENDYGIYSQKKALFKRDDADTHTFLENPNNRMIQEQDFNPKDLKNEKSEELFIVIERFSKLVDDFNALEIKKIPPSIFSEGKNLDFTLEKPKEENLLEKNLLKLYNNIVKNFLICKTKEEKKQFFPEISFEDFLQISNIWNYEGNLSLEIVKHGFIPEKLTYKNLQTLSRNTWLNDEVINSYVRLILNDIGRYSLKRIRIFNTFFFTEQLEKNSKSQFSGQGLANQDKILRIAKKFDVDIFCDIIFIPINIHNNHWIFIEIDPIESTISYFDSFSRTEREASNFFKIIEKFMVLLENNSNVPHKMWKFSVPNFPKQRNMSDCGVFMLKGIHYRALQKEKMFSQKDIPYFRLLITIELVKGNLLNSF